MNSDTGFIAYVLSFCVYDQFKDLSLDFGEYFSDSNCPPPHTHTHTHTHTIILNFVSSARTVKVKRMKYFNRFKVIVEFSQVFVHSCLLKDNL